jgi:murein DD-endopeptidase MepM/ murein hydrolase activator NlpD
VSAWQSRQRFFLAGGLSWLTSIGLVGAPIAIAQTSAPSSDSSTVPGAQDLLTPKQAEPNDTASATPRRSSISIETNAEIPTPEASGSTSSVPPLDVTDLTRDIPMSTQIEIEPSGSSYIDSTNDYSLGATTQDMPSVVLSERSTGCQMVLRRGQAVPSSVCSSSGEAIASYNGVSGNINSVNVGPLSIGPNGISLNQIPSIQRFYHQTIRPQALPNNGNSRLLFPLSIPAMVSSPFGLRIHPIFRTERFHTGTDLAAPMGTPVVAAFSGRVSIADYLRGYGVTVVLRHGDGSQETLYGHMSELFVEPGDWVEQGEVIGRVGSTGNSTGPHLHFELRERTANGWVAINSGDRLQMALGHLGEGFQLAQVSLADQQAELKENDLLSVPHRLQSGKNAIKTSAPLDASFAESDR